MALSLKEPSKKLTFLGMATKKPISYSFFSKVKFVSYNFGKKICMAITPIRTIISFI